MDHLTFLHFSLFLGSFIAFIFYPLCKNNLESKLRVSPTLARLKNRTRNKSPVSSIIRIPSWDGRWKLIFLGELYFPQVYRNSGPHAYDAGSSDDKETLTQNVSRTEKEVLRTKTLGKEEVKKLREQAHYSGQQRSTIYSGT